MQKDVPIRVKSKTNQKTNKIMVGEIKLFNNFTIKVFAYFAQTFSRSALQNSFSSTECMQMRRPFCVGNLSSTNISTHFPWFHKLKRKQPVQFLLKYCSGGTTRQKTFLLIVNDAIAASSQQSPMEEAKVIFLSQPLHE